MNQNPKGFPILVITANRKVILKYAPYLNQVGYHVEIMSQIPNAVDAIRRGAYKPKVVLLSWNLPNENIPELYAKFSNELKVPCIVYSEDQSRKANNDLLKSRISNVIFPPMSGFGIDRRIQQLLRLSGPVQLVHHAEQMNKEEAEMATSIEQDRIRMEEGFKTSIRAVKRPTPQVQAMANKPGKVLMVPVSWGNLEGYLIIGQSAIYSDADLLMLRRSILESLAKEQNIKTTPGDYIEFEILYDDLFDWAREHAEILSSDGERANQLVIAFANLTHLPSISKDVSDDYIWADLDGWIKLNTKLPFDIYVHLATNGKFIRYLRKDIVVSEDTLSRLNKVGSERCFVEPKESPALFRHCIESSINRKKSD